MANIGKIAGALGALVLLGKLVTTVRNNKRKNAKGKEVSNDYQSKNSKGEQILNKTMASGPKNKNPAGPDLNNRGTPPLQKAGVIDIILKNTQGQEFRLSDSYDVEVEESIDHLYRVGSFTIYDYHGTREFTSMLNTLEGETLEVIFRNNYEQESLRGIKFGLYNFMEEPIDGGAFNKVLRKNIFQIIEEPFFNDYNSRTYGTSFNGNTSIEMIASLLATKSKQENLKIVVGNNDPIFPSFIVPNWNIKEVINYLKHFCDGGPVKVFNVTKQRDPVTVVAPLQKIMDGKIFSTIPKIYPSATLKTEDGLPLGPYVIYGPRDGCIRNCLSGQTILSYDYFYGKKNGKTELKAFADNDYAKYEYSKGVPDFNDLSDRSYGNILSGNYGQGSKLVKNIGNYLMFKKDKRSWQDHDIQIDSMEKPLIQAKLKNNFYHAYYNQIMLYTILPGNSSYNVGMVFDIILPSVNQGGNAELGQADETLSGKWMLWKMIHKVSKTKFGADIKYVMHCYFVKTGLELSNNPNRDPVGSNSLSGIAGALSKYASNFMK